MWHQTIKDGKVRYFERYKDADGKTKTASVTYKAHNARNEKAAQAQLARIIQEKSMTSNEHMSFSELCDLYFNAQQGTLKETTIADIKVVIGQLKDLMGNIYVDDLTAGEFQRRMIREGFGPGKQNKLIARLKTVINWGYRMDFVKDVQFLKKFQKNKVQGKDPADKYLERDEIGPIRENLSPKYRDVFDFAILTGCRFGEIAALHVEDVDLTAREIHIHRTFSSQLKTEYEGAKTEDSNRKIYIQDQLLPLCEKLTENALEGDLLFRPRIYMYNFNNALKKASRGLSRVVTSHMLRHTHCSLLAETGMIPLEQISRRLGHADSEITKAVYLHVTEKAREKENERIKALKLF